MKLSDAAFDTLDPVIRDYGEIALILAAAVVIAAGVTLLVLRRRRRDGKKARMKGRKTSEAL